MSKPEYTHEEPTHYTIGDAYYRLWTIIFSLLVIGFILKGYEQPEETRTIPHIWEGRGYVIDLKPVFIDEHCNK